MSRRRKQCCGSALPLARGLGENFNFDSINSNRSRIVWHSHTTWVANSLCCQYWWFIYYIPLIFSLRRFDCAMGKPCLSQPTRTTRDLLLQGLSTFGFQRRILNVAIKREQRENSFSLCRAWATSLLAILRLSESRGKIHFHYAEREQLRC